MYEPCSRKTGLGPTVTCYTQQGIRYMSLKVHFAKKNLTSHNVEKVL